MHHIRLHTHTATPSFHASTPLLTCRTGNYQYDIEIRIMVSHPVAHMAPTRLTKIAKKYLAQAFSLQDEWVTY